MLALLAAVPLIVGAAVVALGAFVTFRARRGLANVGDWPADPTSQEVAPGDVVGQWRFYSDDAGKTVALDFHADGTFAQTILENEGETTNCPGGTWTLCGPYVQLDGYTSVQLGTTRPMSWWMVDTPSGLSLCGGDDEDSLFPMTKIV